MPLISSDVTVLLPAVKEMISRSPDPLNAMEMFPPREGLADFDEGAGRDERLRFVLAAVPVDGAERDAVAVGGDEREGVLTYRELNARQHRRDVVA